MCALYEQFPPVPYYGAICKVAPDKNGADCANWSHQSHHLPPFVYTYPLGGELSPLLTCSRPHSIMERKGGLHNSGFSISLISITWTTLVITNTTSFFAVTIYFIIIFIETNSVKYKSSIGI